MTENKHNCLQGVHTAKITTQADMTNKLTYELTQPKVYPKKTRSVSPHANLG